jgi:VWFA-related protein
MPHSLRLAAVMLVAVGVLSARDGLRAQSQQRGMYVSVLDEKGVPVEGLGVDDFVVREDNVAREVLNVLPATDPIHVAVLIDNSQASDRFIRDYRVALPPFVDALLADAPGATGQNQVAIIALGERPTILTDYTSSRSRLTAAINRLFAMPNSATYLLDGIIEISQGLKKREASRSVIVAVTGEGPEFSERHYQQVLEPLRASGATLHVVTLGQPVNQDQDRSVVLSVGTKDTGGRYDMLLVPSALTMKLKDVADEITSQYRITYSRPETLIPPEKITVSTTRPRLTARGIPVNEPRPSAKEPRER